MFDKQDPILLEEEAIAEKRTAEFAGEGFGAPEVVESGGESFDAPDMDPADEVGDTGNECAEVGDADE